MDLIPITKIKIDKQKWLETKIKYENKLTVENIINEMCEDILKWINNLEEYTLITDEKSFNYLFKKMIYEKYLNYL